MTAPRTPLPAPRRLKVAHVITQLELGGAQQNTLYTCAHLDPARFDAFLVAGRGGLLDSEARSAGYRSYFLEHLDRRIDLCRDWKALRELISVFRIERPDIVHTHSSKAGVLGRLAAFLARVPVRIHTFHGFGFHERQNPLLRFTLTLAEELAAAVSTRLLFVSRANQDTARRIGLGDPAGYALLRSGVRLQDLPAKVDPEAKKAELGAGMHKPLVVSVGNLKPQKRPEDFVAMAAQVLREAPEARFVFIGDGELRGRIQGQLLARNLYGKCFFPGWRRDVPEVLAAADVFVLTSLWEGLPRALVEAMKSGLPPVCYATDGVTDLVRDGENGLLAAPGDHEALARGVLMLLQDPGLRRRLGREAAASIGPEFDIDGMVRAQEDLYESLIKS